MGDIIKTTAIVLESKDYKEKDKLLTILTLEYGIMQVQVKGVKGLGAKLKSAKEPFCFGEYLIASGAGYGVLTGAEIIDSFYDVTLDYDRFNYACNILIVAKEVCKNKEPNKEIFIECLKALKNLAYEKTNANYIFIKYLLNVIRICGYGLAYDKCNSCKGQWIKKYFDYSMGALVCNNCKSSNSEEIENVVFTALRLINDAEYEKLSSISLAKGSEKKALKILCENFNYRFEKKLNLDFNNC